MHEIAMPGTDDMSQVVCADRAPDQAAVIAGLADLLGQSGDVVERIDTHASVVLLAGDRAWKLKRAVRYPYLDYSTLLRRRHACMTELVSNRRTAPDLYLGLRALTAQADGTLTLDPVPDQALGETTHAGERVLEWLVEMRRFDQEDRLDRVAGRGALVPALIDDLARTVADFHGAAEPRPDYGGAAALAAVHAGNLTDLRTRPALFPASAIDQLADATGRLLDRHAPLLDRRRAAGFVRHAHGDLHLRNICLYQGRTTVFDAIEFDPALAIIDVFYDLAYLLMDLDARGLRPQANRLLNRYLQITGDHAGLAPLPLFLSLRAAVRAKVSAAAAALQTAPAESSTLLTEAGDYFRLAIRLGSPPPARLVAIGGLSGSGKSTLAEALAPGLGPVPGAVVVRSDSLRKQHFGVAETDRLPPSAYEEPVTALVYGRMLAQAEAILAAGHAVILDGVFARPEQRHAVAAVAGPHPWIGCWLEADPAVLMQRVAARTGDASDATPAVVLRQCGFDLGPVEWFRLDAAASQTDLTAAAQRLLAAPPPARR